MAAISVRGLDEAQLHHLKEQARQQGISLNRLVLHRLAGEAIAPLEQVDPELWA